MSISKIEVGARNIIVLHGDVMTVVNIEID
jgi:hypothetical protein